MVPSDFKVFSSPLTNLVKNVIDLILTVLSPRNGSSLFCNTVLQHSVCDEVTGTCQCGEKAPARVGDNLCRPGEGGNHKNPLTG